MAKYDQIIYKTGSFCGGSNINLNLITCDNNFFIKLIIQSYVSHWYHMYILHPGIDKMEAMVFTGLAL